MGLKQLRWVIVVGILIFGGTAKADSVYFNGSYAFGSGGYGIPPYGGTLDGQSAAFYCVDFTHDITGGTGWEADVTSLTGSDFSLTRLGNQNLYLDMAWLVTQMMGTSNQNLQAQYQYAIWSITGGPDPFGTDATWVAAANAAVQSGFDGTGFLILTPKGSYGQEFLVQTPEPSTIILLGIAFAGVVALTRRVRTA
jgi:PEP-CTERM motif